VAHPARNADATSRLELRAKRMEVFMVSGEKVRTSKAQVPSWAAALAE
jgi:hypothetical protein